LTSDGAGGAIIAWSDQRDDNSNIYASRIFSDGALPVELASFQAIVEGSEVKLLWTTATEVNCAGFEVERRGTGEWENICFVAGNGTSSSPNRYLFIDHNIVPGRYSYRFKEIDRDGTSRLSPEEEVEVGSLPASFALSQNYPNPFNPTTTIGFAVPFTGHVSLKVYDMLGKEVATLVNGELPPGAHRVAFDASRMASGVYFTHLEFGGKQLLKKMLLVK
jgi:hypothetical protein